MFCHSVSVSAVWFRLLCRLTVYFLLSVYWLACLYFSSCELPQKLPPTTVDVCNVAQADTRFWRSGTNNFVRASNSWVVFPVCVVTWPKAKHPPHGETSLDTGFKTRERAVCCSACWSTFTPRQCLNVPTSHHSVWNQWGKSCFKLFFQQRFDYEGCMWQRRRDGGLVLDCSAEIRPSYTASGGSCPYFGLPTSAAMW